MDDINLLLILVVVVSVIVGRSEVGSVDIWPRQGSRHFNRQFEQHLKSPEAQIETTSQGSCSTVTLQARLSAVADAQRLRRLSGKRRADS